MTQSLDDMVTAASGNVSQQPLSRRQVVPYADLQTLNQPPDLNQLSNALVSAIAILSAQGKDRPRLLSVDAQGRLITSAAGNSLAKFAAAFNGGGTLVTVDDSSGFYPGQIVAFASASGSGAACGGMTVESIPDSTHIQVFSSCVGQNFVVGDFVVGRNTTTLDNTGVTYDVSDRAARLLGQADITDRAARLLGHVTVDSDMAPSQSVGIYGHSASGPQHITASVDNTGQVHANVRATADMPTGVFTANFGSPATPSLSINAISGLAIDLLGFSIVIANVSGAVAYTGFATIKSTGTGAATLWSGQASVLATPGSRIEIPQSQQRIVTQPGQGLAIALDTALPAGYGAAINTQTTAK